MLLIGLIGYLMASSISNHQEDSARWTIITIFTSILLLISITEIDDIIIYNDLLVINSFIGYFIILVIVVTIVNANDSKYTLIIILGLCGTLLLIAANNLTIVLLALELQSFAAYLTVATTEKSSSLSVSLKYFFYGCIASAFIVIGFGLLYGGLGLLNLIEIGFNLSLSSSHVQNNESIILVFGLLFVFIGLSFKIGGVPFHFWTPIVYSEIGDRLISYLSIVPKLGVLILLYNMRDCFSSCLTNNNFTDPLIILLILIVSFSLIVGALGGLLSSSFRILIVYSSINHVGFIILLIITSIATPEGIADNGTGDLLFYIIQYSLTLVLVLHLDKVKSINVYTCIICICVILSIAGVPPFIGFYTKLIVFNKAISCGYYILAFIALFTSILTVYYYLSIIGQILIKTVIKAILQGNTVSTNDPIYYFYSCVLFIITFYILFV